MARRDRGPEARPAPATCWPTRPILGLGAAALGKDKPSTRPSDSRQPVCYDDLLESSIPRQFKNASTPLVADRSDLEPFARRGQMSIPSDAE